MTRQLWLPIEETSQVADARRQAMEMARTAGFDETDRGRVALATTEAATNIIKHAGHGSMLVRLLAAGTAQGIEIIALDDGPGLGNGAHSFEDGHSTTGTAGTGLGAMTRMTDELDWYSAPEHGTVFRMALWAARTVPPRRMEVGAICVALPGEPIPGDDWRIELDGSHCVVMVCDGLGHGLEAYRAARAATDLLDNGLHRSVTDLMLDAHDALRPTRGAALSAATMDLDAGTLRYAGVGNVAAYVCDGKSRRQLISHNGIVGHTLRKLQAFDLRWDSGKLFLMHTDGLSSQWSFEDFPGLDSRHPAVIAAMIYKKYWRRRDDVTVIVIRPE